ncbi:MAG: glycosyltransferase, partial [Candidatus Omnitrophica bacterium]|nr:glycosyltransferase [Candidatus Omnitrophota bacterium]
IYNSIELDRFTVNYESPNLRKELRIEDNEIVIGTVSRLVPQKGIDILLEAAKELMSGFTQVKFLIVGDGYLRKDLETKAKLLRIEDKVIFTGLRKDIFLLLSIMDIFVQPSLKEGLPLSVLEAQATGVPVIAANVPGNNELIIHKETGLLVPPQDKEALRQSLSFLIKNYSLAKEMAQRAKEYCQQKFNAKIMIQQIDKLYSQLLK